MSDLPMAGQPGETPEERYRRLEASAQLNWRLYEDARDESDRARLRAHDAAIRANESLHEAQLARSAYRRWIDQQGSADDP